MKPSRTNLMIFSFGCLGVFVGFALCYGVFVHPAHHQTISTPTRPSPLSVANPVTTSAPSAEPWDDEDEYSVTLIHPTLPPKIIGELYPLKAFKERGGTNR